MKHNERLEKKSTRWLTVTKLNLKGSDSFGNTAFQEQEIDGLACCNPSKISSRLFAFDGTSFGV